MTEDRIPSGEPGMTVDLPPVPGGTCGPRLWFWRMVIALAALLGFAQPWLGPDTGSLESSSAGGLAVFEIQARLLVGVDYLLRQMPTAARGQAETDLQKSLETLAKEVRSDRSTLAVAALQGWLAAESGTAQAVALIDARLKVPVADDDPMRPVLRLGRHLLASGEPASPEDAALLEKNLGWFATLLISRTDDAVRQQLGKACLPGALISLSVPVVVVLFGLLGLVLILVAIVGHNAGRFRFALPQAQSLDLSDETRDRFELVFSQAFAAYLTIMVVFNLPFFDTFGLGFALVGLFGAFLAGLFLPRFRGLPWGETRRLLGWHRGAGLLKELGCGITGYFAMLPVLAIGVAATLLLMGLAGLVAGSGGDSSGTGPVGPSAPVHPIVFQVAHGGWGVKIAILFLATVLAPLFEETMFRGFFYRVLRRRHAFLLSGLVSGFLFAMVHPQGWIAIPALASIGFSLAGIREWRDSLIASMTAHALNNGLVISLLFVVFGI